MAESIPGLSQIKDIVQIVGGLANIAGVAKSFSGGGEGERGSTPQAVAPAAPEAPSLKPDRTNFGAPPEPSQAPTFLGLSGALSPEQQRARIATMALAGGDTNFTGSQATDFYKNVAQRSLTTPEGNVAPGASVLPIERTYAQNVLGKKFSSDSTENFLTQLLSP